MAAGVEGAQDVVGQPVQVTAARVRVSSAKQIGALMKKNMRVHMRSNACPCCPGCNIRGIPLFSACLCHCCCPIAFVFVITAIPWIIIKIVASPADQKAFLEPGIEKGRNLKPWPGTDLDLYKGDDNGCALFSSVGPCAFVGDAMTGSRPLLDSLFIPKPVPVQAPRRGGDGVCKWEIESCHCATLALVGPEPAVSELKAYLEDQYTQWLIYTGDVDNMTSQRQKWTMEFAARTGYQSGRRLEERPSSPPRFGPGPFSGKDLREGVESFLEGAARRLQSGGNQPVCKDPATSAYCDVDPGKERPLFRIFKTESAIDDMIQSAEYGRYEKARSETSQFDRICGAIILENDVLTAAKPAFKVRCNVTQSYADVSGDLTAAQINPSGFGTSYLLWYYDSGFFALQHLTHRFLGAKRAPVWNSAAKTEGIDYLYSEPQLIATPSREMRTWNFGQIVSFILGNPLVMAAMFGPITASIAYYTSKERQTRQRELMRMMGLTDGALIWSWVLMFAAINLLITFCQAVLFRIFFFLNTDLFLLWMMLWFFANAITTQGMFVAAVVTSDRMAAMSAFAVFFGSAFLSILIQDYDPEYKKVLISLIPADGFTMSMGALWKWETEGSGNTVGNVYAKIQNFSFGSGIWMLFLDFWLFLGLYYYVDNIAFWHQVGVGRKPWFMFTASYWREMMGKPPRIPTTPTASGKVDDEEKATVSGQDSGYFQSEDEVRLKHMLQSNQAVVIRNLFRSFVDASGNSIHAVQDLSLTMYQDECFCLLGHNGAGKTTTMMMLTGCLPQSKGSIKVKGHTVPEQIRDIRSDMGFCPQHNVLVDELTVFEHLELFGTIGGMTKERLVKRGRELLAAVALLDKIHARSSSLSGGMKRKLSCALAFLAEPYLVILDEPSSGMDPFARRGMWDTLKRWRTGHILCLTTHYMDEADALGDRIAIMSEGKLACSGSPNFLKKRFGCGYVISFAKNAEGTAIDGKILKAVQAVVGNEAQIMSTVGKELLVEVPFSAADKFSVLFPQIDAKQVELGIESYGTSITNLEEVFLKVARMKKHNESVKDEATSAPDELLSMTRASLPTQVGALLIRRFKFGFRNKGACCCQIGLPVICLFVFMLIIFSGVVNALPALLLDTSRWNMDLQAPYKTPITVGYRAGDATIETEVRSVWAPGGSTSRPELGFDYTNVVGVTPYTYPLPYPNATNPQSPTGPVAGIAEEGPFVQNLIVGISDLAASQYGGLYYPQISSWCPKENPQVCSKYPGVTVAGNQSALHSQATLLSVHASAFLAQRTKGSANPIEKIDMTNHPFEKTKSQRDNAERVTGILAAIIIMASYGFVPSGATSYVVMEREKEVKNQLIISGCSYTAYWLSNFIFDTLWGLIPAVGAWIIFGIFGIDAYTKAPGVDSSVALFIVFLPAMSGFAYLFSFMFSKSGVALFVSWIFNMLFGILATITVSILYFISGARATQVALRWIFRFVPIFSLGYGHLVIGSRQKAAADAGVGALTGLGMGTAECPAGVKAANEDQMCNYMVGDEFFALVLCGFVYIVLTIALDVVTGLPRFKQVFGGYSGDPPPSAGAEDEMVLAEKGRVNQVDKMKQFVYVNNIHKVYRGGGHAVRGVSFAAEEGQVFGLLGVNGAGKTTTFKMLCGQVAPTCGEVRIQGYDMSTQAAEARKLIGYCPQFDALLDSLTTQEHLYLYGRLKGLTGSRLTSAVSNSMRDLDLTSYVRSRAGQLSGGNKRKLSVAMATIGEPPMVFLDEPSAGMDPVARRGMWTVIQNIAEKRKKSVVILTTHSMEEAEALCSRIAIQVDGKFRCLGTAQQIKTKYGEGLELNVRFGTPTATELEECCGKFGGDPSTRWHSQEASDKVTAVFGEGLKNELAIRPGSPLTAGGSTSLNVLAEWVLLAKRTLDFEAFLAQTLGAELEGQGVAVPLEKSQNVVRYQILPIALVGRYKSLGALFNLFEENKVLLKLEDFQVCQPSLEQIFNRFATTQASQAPPPAEAWGSVATGQPVGSETPVLELPKGEAARSDWPQPSPIGKPADAAAQTARSDSPQKPPTAKPEDAAAPK